MNKLLLTIYATLLTACTTYYWTNTYNPNADFRNDNGICTNEAIRAIPDQQSNMPSSSSTNCYGGYGTVNCNTTYNNAGANIGSAISTGLQRDSYIDNCLYAKGWRKTDAPSTKYSPTLPPTYSYQPPLPGKTSQTKPSVENSKLKPENFDFYTKLANKEDEEAQITLGDMYFSGIGTDRDYAQALHWYKKVAMKGKRMPLNRMAQKKLGIMYELGLGVERNQSEANKWYEESKKTDK